jgi:hypothetical protein
MRKPRFFLALFSLILVVACTNNDADSTPVAQATVVSVDNPTSPAVDVSTATPVPTDTATATPTPSHTPTSTSTPTATATSTPRPVTEEDLTAALLALGDMPTGFTLRVSDEEDGEEGDEDDGGDTYTFLGQELPRRALFSVGVEFEQGQFGPFLNHTITVYPPDEAADVFADFDSVIQSSEPFTLTLDDETSLLMELSPMSFSTLGDESVAARASTDQVPILGLMQMNVVYIRRGNIVMSLQSISFGLQQPDIEELETLAQRALEKLDEVLNNQP